MSRNKTIAYFHSVTGLPYSVCRARLKACKWDLWEALGYNDIKKMLDALPDIMNTITEGLADLSESIGNGFLNLAKSLRGQNNEK